MDACFEDAQCDSGYMCSTLEGGGQCVPKPPQKGTGASFCSP